MPLATGSLLGAVPVEAGSVEFRVWLRRALGCRPPAAGDHPLTKPATVLEGGALLHPVRTTDSSLDGGDSGSDPARVGSQGVRGPSRAAHRRL